MAHSAAKRSSPDIVRPNMGNSSDDDRPHSCGKKIEERSTTHLNLVLLGKTGAGKSASGNTILGRQAFTLKRSSRSVTRDVAVESGTVDGLPITVYDTPGLSTESEEELRKYEEDTQMSDEEIQQMINEKVLQRCESDLCVFLLVIKADGFIAEDQKPVQKIEELLGEKHIDKTWILFTRGDELEEQNKSINQLISETEFLKKLTQKYEGRFHEFNNKTKGESVQVKSLIAKVFQEKKGNVSNRQSIPISIQDTRIVLLGKSGVGKSAAGNIILGESVFKSVMSVFTVTHESSVKHATVSGRSVSVVDTPGFFDTLMNTEELMTEIARSVYISSPGPHAFLFVFPVNMRITEEDQKITEQIKTLFGEEVLKYSIILFTRGDQLEEVETVEELIQENSRLRDLVDQCGGRFHVFNNRDMNNRDQVNDLLQKIDTMIEQNGGGHYSNEMFEDAQRLRREEEERRQREEEERRQQEKQTQAKIARMIKKFGAELETQRRSEIERHKVKKQSEEEGAIVNFIHFCPSIRITLFDGHCSRFCD